MIDKQKMEAIDKGFITLNVIWGAMLFSLFIYLFVAHYLKGSIEASLDENTLGLFRSALYAVSAVTLISSFYIRKLILRTKRMSGRQVPEVQSPAVARYFTALIVTLALCESVGIYGLVLFLMGKNSTDLYLFIAVSVAAMVYYRPRKEEVLELAKELRK